MFKKKSRQAGSRMREKAIILFLGCLFLSKAQATESDLMITEIMYDASGADGGHEWIEVFNSGPDEVTVSSSWRFFDGSNHNLNLEQSTTTVASQDFFILADNKEFFLVDYPDFSGLVIDTVMNLPNSSSTIGLSFDAGASYGLTTIYDSNWGGANGFSLQKINETWGESCNLGGTPGLINSECAIEDDPPEDDPPTEDQVETNEAWFSIIISEFLPNPAGSDDNEWIELFNQADRPLVLNGFSLGDNSSRRFTIAEADEPDFVLTAKAYLLLPKSQTGISLNNSGTEAVKLYNPQGELQETVEYSGPVFEDRSYARTDGGFVWTKSPTPGSVNIIVENQAPLAQISIEGDFKISQKIDFSGENSSDPEGDDLDYYWDFGDGTNSSKVTIKHKFERAGNFTVRLTVTDPEGATDQAEFILDIYPEVLAENVADEKEKKETDELADLLIAEIDFAEDDLIISEFIPNPKGSDDNEWIELYNSSNKNINLAGWYLDDAEGGSKPYQFSTSTTITMGSFLVIERADSKLTLNNSTDAVRLIKPDGNIWQEIIYEKIPEEKTYAWDLANSEWFIADPSPGQPNLKMQTQEARVIYLVSEIANLEKNQPVLVQGAVVNSPNQETRSIYLADFDGQYLDVNSLVEIYSYYKDFPELKVGQVVTVQGEISKIDALPRLKIKSAEQVIVNDQSVSFKKPEALSPDDLDEDFLGSYLTVKGVVVKKSGQSIYLATDAESDYGVRVYTKFSTKELDIKKGSELVATGILSATDSGYKLEPFSITDFGVSQEVLGEKIVADSLLDNREIVTSTNQASTDGGKDQVKKILFILIIGILVLVGIYFIKKRASGITQRSQT